MASVEETMMPSPSELSAVLLDPRRMADVLYEHELLLPKLTALWLSPSRTLEQQLSAICAFAKLLPIVPYLVDHTVVLLDMMQNKTSSTRALDLLLDLDQSLGTLCRSLKALLRLLTHDLDRYSKYFTAVKLVDVLRSTHRPIRYLAVRILAVYAPFSDRVLKQYLAEHIGTEAVLSLWEDKTIDYVFLDMWEERRLSSMDQQLRKIRSERILGTSVEGSLDRKNSPNLPYVGQVGDVLIPSQVRATQTSHELVNVRSTERNLHRLGMALLTQKPILLSGLSESGKTVLVAAAARKLGKLEGLLVLHLNQQTDPRALVGSYISDAKPGTFLWKPGVLSTALLEGRWILIEDIDQAPNEVLSLLLPVIEDGKLEIPGRGEIIAANQGFRLFATIRSLANAQQTETTPAIRILGSWRWSQIHVEHPSEDELLEIITKRYPGLATHAELLKSLLNASHVGTTSCQGSTRISNIRDILKFASRMHSSLSNSGCFSGAGVVPEYIYDHMFLDAVDCLALWISIPTLRRSLIEDLARSFHVAPSRIALVFEQRSPAYSEDKHRLRVGRALIPKRLNQYSLSSDMVGRKPPFANTRSSMQLLETILQAANAREPVLLVGETGTGKTTIVQRLSDAVRQDLHVINLSQQTELSDLVGGLKPVTIQSVAIPLKADFDDLFASTFSTSKNQQFLQRLGRCIVHSQWDRAIKYWREAVTLAETLFASTSLPKPIDKLHNGDLQAAKRRKVIHAKAELLIPRWLQFAEALGSFQRQIKAGDKGFAFKFVESQLIRAVRTGSWVLLDEINLASSETLDAIADLLVSDHDGGPAILLSESGRFEWIRAHPDFRIFAAMNPATDVGKRDLANGLRTRFTELFVYSPDENFHDLQEIVKIYLKPWKQRDERAISDVSNLHLAIKQLDRTNQLIDGSGQKPHFSLRTLTRAMSFAVEISPLYGIRRSLYEAFSMTFLTFLNLNSESLVTELIFKHLLGSHRNAKSILGQVPSRPLDGRTYISFEHYWMLAGDQSPIQQAHYIVTPFVRKNLLNLVRASSSRRYPVLLQGPTSSGKTSMVEYLAKLSGNEFVRINNHEFTDLQEYLGQYVSGQDGKIVFQEGVLVSALRKGSWIVLDELNLAPTEVLEALNRLLDDNQELLIPETQEVLRPHPSFMLFATQNPAGLYGGRKHLSRALRNRFIELHFDDIPELELEIILTQRTRIAPSFCSKIVATYKELSMQKSSSRLFEQKNSFATLRDLFRWAQRYAESKEDLAMNGFALLGERVRTEEERLLVKSVIEKVMKVQINLDEMYSEKRIRALLPKDFDWDHTSIVWTSAMRRLFILLAETVKHDEPVLLVGETGTGKTSVCQIMAQYMGKQLSIVNAHQNTETGDIIGQYRPVRNRDELENSLQELLQGNLGSPDDTELASLAELLKLWAICEDQGAYPAGLSSDTAQEVRRLVGSLGAIFEWTDGSLVEAMKQGRPFLLDEISLADDAVLERLNSILESSRSLLLAEKGPTDSYVEASAGFQFFATMNPGGDYGKKELSPALRNRFTEIWVPALHTNEDILQIVQARLRPELRHLAAVIVGFSSWYGETHGSQSTFSLRSVLTWIEYINSQQDQPIDQVVIDGANLAYLDSIGADPSGSSIFSTGDIGRDRAECVLRLSQALQIQSVPDQDTDLTMRMSETSFTIGHSSIQCASAPTETRDFSLEAPTSRLNMMRIIRAMRVRKPLLLEGSPGVGKTTLVAALAKITGHPLFRLNLSEQTDLTDLFGSDAPVSGEAAGHFAWRNGPFLSAMQSGHWVLLDEMNLASQSVLEGLNACLDHRAEIFIPELGRKFGCHPEFRIFATQNPYSQGGGRKGLPKSFVNRFTTVYAEALDRTDLQRICRAVYPGADETLVQRSVDYITNLDSATTEQHVLGFEGQPWEFNLRDVLRWVQLSTRSRILQQSGHSDHLNLIARGRFRNPTDRQKATDIYNTVCRNQAHSHQLYCRMSPGSFQVGHSLLKRPLSSGRTPPSFSPHKSHLAVLETLLENLNNRWPCLLVGSSAAGKTNLIRYLAFTMGARLRQLNMNPDFEASDIIGGFEQADVSRRLSELRCSIERKLQQAFDRSVTIPELLVPTLTISQMLGHRGAVPLNLGDVIARLGELQTKSPEMNLGAILQDAMDLQTASQHSEPTSFRWIDGPLIQALEQGEWIILDNANLCNASVLDRLNSLLEPDGAITLGEQTSSDGIPRLVKPHPDFRIFLMMDPKHGELSRALRNRCVEVFVPNVYAEIPNQSWKRVVSGNCGWSQGLQDIVGILRRQDANVAPRAVWADLVERLSWNEMSVLERFCFEMDKELASCDFDTRVRVVEQLRRSLCLLQTSWADKLEKNLMALRQTYRYAEGFIRAQPINLLLNSSLVFTTSLSAVFATSGSLDETSTPRALLAIANEPNPDPVWLSLLLHLTMSLILVPTGLEHAAGDALMVLESDLPQLAEAAWEAGQSTDPSQLLRSQLAEYFNGVKNWKHVEGVPPVHKIASIYWLSDTNFLLEEVMTVLSTAEAFNDDAAATISCLYRCFASEHGQHAVHCGLLSERLFHQAKSFRADQASQSMPMELLWSALAPRSITDPVHWNATQRVEALASELEQVLWLEPINVELGYKIWQLTHSLRYRISRGHMNQIEDAMHQIRDAAQQLAKEEEGLEKLYPIFKDEFASVSLRLSAAAPERPLLQFLANRTAIPFSHRAPPFDRSDLVLCGQGALLEPLVSRTISSLSVLRGGTLRQLSLSYFELGTLSKTLARNPHLLNTDPASEAMPMLDKAMNLICQCIAERQGSSSVPANLSSMSAKFMTLQSLGVQTGHPAQRATKWLSFGFSCLRSYITRKPYDPQLMIKVRADLLRSQLEKHMSNLEAWKWVEHQLSGGEWNLKIAWGEHELDRLRQRIERESSGIERIRHRPSKSRLKELHRTLVDIRGTLPLSAQEDEEMAVRLVQSHDPAAAFKARRELIIVQLSALQEFGEYRDLITPPQIFLECVYYGLCLMEVQQRTATGGDSESGNYAPTLIPLLNATPQSLSLYAELKGNTGVASVDWETRLQVCSLLIPLQGTEKRKLQVYRTASASFHELYWDWKSQLRVDQERNAAKSSLYRYVGLGENDEDVEELSELFGELISEGRSKSYDAKSSGQQVAKLHAAVFTPEIGESADDRLVDMIRQYQSDGDRARLMSLSHEPETEALVSVLLLRLQDAKEELADVASPSISFYHGINIKEIRRLVGLLYAIQDRFMQLRVVWPEHSSILDTLSKCKEILGRSFRESLANLTTEVEQLHAIIYEWQSIADRENSVAALYDQLTELLISWRRLELRSWSALLKAEEEKCIVDAYDWWYIGYEAVVMSCEDSTVDQQQIVKLVATLQDFLSATPLGQFNQRLMMLTQYAAELGTGWGDSKLPMRVRDAVLNVIRCFTRFGRYVDEHLEGARKKLQKEIDEVILLATWKDTNIVALRESARRSHMKLLRIVRKYRKELSKAAQEIMPDPSRTLATMCNPPVQAISEDCNEPVELDVSVRIGSLASALDSGHDFSVNRFRLQEEAYRIVRNSVRASRGSCDTVDEEMLNFTSNVSRLQKQGPQVLTEENKSEIKHLRAQKRRLFAETLKMLKDMGIRAALDSTTIEKQQGAAELFSRSSLPSKSGDEVLAQAEEAFYQVVELAPQIWKCATQHSEEITAQEIIRSTGLLHGCIYEVVRQRSALATSYGTIVELKSMQESCRILETIEIDGPDELHEFEKSHDRNYVHEALAWSTLLMKTASKILNVQDELSQHELPSVQQEWQEWIRLLEIQERAVHLTLRVPSSLVGSKEVLAIRHGKKVLQHLGKELQLLGSQRPELHYLTCQVALWTDVRCYPVVDGSRKARASSRLDQVPDKALNVANTILAAVATMASALQEIPRDPEQKQWWVQTARCLITALLKPHLVELNDEWSAVLRAVQGMGSATRSQRLRLKSSFVILSTVLGQYVRVYQSVADHLAMIYRSTAHMTVTLSQNFLLISKRGFCTPGEKSKQESQGNEKLEAGTGLGEGDGAEDISKDIGDDEDLSELAQEPKAQREDGEDGDLENEKDAVEIADEMEGQIGEGEEEDDDGDERSNDGEDGDVDEELGSVGSAEAGALDESHMDGKQDESKKEEEGRKDKGETSKDEQAAARQKQGKISEADDATASDQEDEDEDEAENGDDTRTGARDDAQADPHAQDQTQLDLPEDMDLDLDKEEGKSDYNDSDEMDAMSDVSGTENLPDAPETQEQSERRQELDRLLEEQLEELENEQQNNDAGEDEDRVSESAEGENYGDQAEETAEEALDENDSAMRGEQEDENEDLPMRNDDGNLLQVPGVADDADPGDTAPSDAIGQGEEQAQEQQNQDPQRQPGAPSQREKGQQGRAGETDQTIGDRGEDEAEYVPHSGKSEPKSRRPRQENSEKVSKQLGDGSEQFHRGNEDLLPANKDEDLPEDGGKGLDGGEYQHLSNEDESYDTQALGAAETEQVPPVNEAMAIDDGEETSEPMNIDNIVPSESEKLNQINEPMNLDKENEEQMRQQDSFTQVQPYINRPSQSQAEHSTNPHANGEGHSAHGNGLDVEESLVDDRTPPQQEASILELITPSQAASLWSHYISRTMPLSHLLTESLRLILTPTRATKFRGAFKTGRRLNMRRIIPYVASGYKKDKIWMRRSVAGKREYRILIGIDGSRSMGEALTSVPAPPTQSPGPFSTSTTDRSLRARTAGEMALYTLALLSQSLSTLEIPQLAILSFGDQPTVHKPFDQPLTPQLGQGIVQQVNFREERTDVRRLLETSLEMFRRDAAAAGMRGGAGGDAKVWGLMIILGDGICEEHELLRRLVRALRDECRVLVVFVVVDVPAPVVQSQPQSGTGATADRPPTAPSTGLQGPAHAGTAGKGADGGIMTMTQARFETEPGTGEARLVMERYLDRFPFEYYVIVRRVEELPGVLSEALRGWFREVVDV